MIRTLLFSICCAVFSWNVCAQSGTYRIVFEHFEESRGDGFGQLITELPYSEVVLSYNPLNSNSGLGTTFNFHGNIVVVDQFNTLDNGAIQVVLRREDGRNFFGYTPTLKAILVPSQ